jgi:hypothetical protein
MWEEVVFIEDDDAEQPGVKVKKPVKITQAAVGYLADTWMAKKFKFAKGFHDNTDPDFRTQPRIITTSSKNLDTGLESLGYRVPGIQTINERMMPVIDFIYHLKKGEIIWVDVAGNPLPVERDEQGRPMIVIGGGGGGGHHGHGGGFPSGVMMGPGWGSYDPYPYPGADPWMFEEMEYQNEVGKKDRK